MDAIIDDDVRRFRIGESIDLEAATRRIALSLAAWVLLGERLDRLAPPRSRTINARSSDGWATGSAS